MLFGRWRNATPNPIHESQLLMVVGVGNRRRLRVPSKSPPEASPNSPYSLDTERCVFEKAALDYTYAEYASNTITLDVGLSYLDGCI